MKMFLKTEQKNSDKSICKSNSLEILRLDVA